MNTRFYGQSDAVWVDLEEKRIFKVGTLFHAPPYYYKIVEENNNTLTYISSSVKKDVLLNKGDTSSIMREELEDVFKAGGLTIINTGINWKTRLKKVNLK